jgi:hypothetical protein
VGVNLYTLEYLMKERLAELHRAAEAHRMAAQCTGGRRAGLAERVRQWLSALRGAQRQVRLTGTRAAR